MITLNQTIIIPDTILVQEIDSEMVLMDINSDSYYGLDEVGCSIWKVIEASHGLLESYNRLLEIYDVEPETLKKDLLTFVETLAQNGLIRYQKEKDQDN